MTEASVAGTIEIGDEPYAKATAELKRLGAERFAVTDDKNLQEALLEGLKVLFDSALKPQGEKFRKAKKKCGLVSLEVNGFDHNQIWSMLKSANNPLIECIEARIEELEDLDSEDLQLAPQLHTYEDDEISGSDVSEDEDCDSVASFISAKKFDGARDDMIFKKGPKGLGYYKDGISSGLDIGRKESNRVDAKEKKRVSFDVDGDDVHTSSDSEYDSAEKNDNESVTEADDEFFKFSEMEAFAESVEAEDIARKQAYDEWKESLSKEKKSVPPAGADFVEQDDYSDDGEEEIPAEDDDSEEEEDEFAVVEKEDQDYGAKYTHENMWGKQKKSRKEKGSIKGQSEASHEQSDSENDSEEVSENDSLSDDDDSVDPDMLSTHERKQRELRRRIKEIEKEALIEKSWDMKGESQARVRPQNSLLEKGDLDVEYLSKPAPAITQETTKTLEDRIRQRVLDNDFDDVERVRPLDQDADYRPKVELSMEKSTSGLGEEYAKAYEEKFLSRNPEEVSKRDTEKKELDELFGEICSKLDSLSNFYYTPKVPKSAGDVLPLSSSAAAVQMEEAIPVTESLATQAAPEEVLAPTKGTKHSEKAVGEMSQEERKNKRRAMKTAKRNRKRLRDAEKKIVSKLNPGLGNKHAKEKVVTGNKEDNVDWTKSDQVFRQLNATQSNPDEISARTLKSTQQLATGIPKPSASRLKL